MRINQFINAEPKFSERDCSGFGWQFHILGIIRDDFTKKHGSALAESIMDNMGLNNMDPIILHKTIGIIYQGRIFRNMFSKTALALIDATKDCADGKIAINFDAEDISNPVITVESWDFGDIDELKKYA